MKNWTGWKCPADPTHGRLMEMTGNSKGFYCPHQGHNGTSRAHPNGPSGPTQKWFTLAEVEAARTVK